MRPRTTTVTHRFAMLTFALSIALAVTGCSGDDDDAAATTIPSATSVPTSATTTTPTTTTAPTTTTTSPSATTTTAPTTTTIDTNTLASGSGCTPGPGALPDGEWFGLVADASSGAIEFDLACWFTGDPAITAAAEDGEESPPPNDYYVRNTNPALRTVPVSTGAQVVWLPNIGDPASAVTIDYPDWLTGRVTRGLALQPGVWITVAAGEVVTIEEQWVP